LRELPVGSTHFRRQATIGPYFTDFACHRCKIVIELDGSQHAETENAAADAKRTKFLEAHGYRVLRFWNNDVLWNIEGVMTMIHEALQVGENEAPHP
jgi:very-short-patch-repair endonuclease